MEIGAIYQQRVGDRHVASVFGCPLLAGIGHRHAVV